MDENRNSVPRRDLWMEAHFRAVALWYEIFGVLSWLLALGILYYMREKYDLPPEKIVSLKIGAITCLGWGALMFAVGWFLDRLSEPARVIARILTLLMILGWAYFIVRPRGGIDSHSWFSVVYAVFSILGLLAVGWALANWRSAVFCTEDYRTLVKNTPSERPATLKSPFFWVPLVWLSLTAVVRFVMWKVEKG
jgi:hypothetical protein